MLLQLLDASRLPAIMPSLRLISLDMHEKSRCPRHRDHAKDCLKLSPIRVEAAGHWGRPIVRDLEQEYRTYGRTS